MIRIIETRIPANANGNSILTLAYNLAGVTDHTFKLFIDNYDGKPNDAGEEEWSKVKVEVKPSSVLASFMNCSDLALSAERGNPVLDMSCEVHFTNPTDIEWEITRIDTEARILKTEYTKDSTIEPTKTITLHIVSTKGVGEFKLEFHDVLSQFTVSTNGHHTL